MNLILATAAHYIIVLAITSSHAGAIVRSWLAPLDRLVGYGFSECRICIGFWIALVLGPIYGICPISLWGLSQILVQFEPEETKPEETDDF